MNKINEILYFLSLTDINPVTVSLYQLIMSFIS